MYLYQVQSFTGDNYVKPYDFNQIKHLNSIWVWNVITVVT